EALIDEELVIVEIQIREDCVLVEEIIADRRLREEVALPHRHLLPMTIEQIEQLRLQRRTGPPAVEVREKGILRLLDDRRGIESRRQTFRERALAHTDWPFDRDVLKRHERGAGRSPRGCMLSSPADVSGDRHTARSNLPDADGHVPRT